MRTAGSLFLMILALAAGAATATAGGWATVALNSTPDEVGPGGLWKVEMDIRQHGVTPLSGDWAKPAMIVNGKRYPAKFSGRDGIFTAEIALPKTGEVVYAADDGFSQTHEFPPVTFDDAAAIPVAPATNTAAPSGGGDDGWLIGALAAMSLLTGLAAFVWRPRRRAGRRAAVAVTTSGS